jgi:hypothetical protein
MEPLFEQFRHAMSLEAFKALNPKVDQLRAFARQEGFELRGRTKDALIELVWKYIEAKHQQQPAAEGRRGEVQNDQQMVSQQSAPASMEKGKEKENEPDSVDGAIDLTQEPLAKRPRSEEGLIANSEILDELRFMCSKVAQLEEKFSAFQRREKSVECWPDYELQSERSQYEYDNIKEVARLLICITPESDPAEMYDIVQKALARLEKRAVVIITGSEENWETAKALEGASDTGSFLKKWTRNRKEARQQVMNASKAVNKKRRREFVPFFREFPSGQGGQYQQPRRAVIPIQCWRCNGPHLARMCPQWKPQIPNKKRNSNKGSTPPVK